MNRPNPPDGPEDVDATFARIVADLRAEGVGVLADDVPPVGDTPAAPAPKPPAAKQEPDTVDTDAGWRTGGSDWDATIFGDDPGSEDEHYLPPEPPPLPRPRKGAFVVLLFFVMGLLLLIAPAVVGVSVTVATPLGILALATGIALLLLRVRQGPPPGADPSNGAQV